MRGQADAKHLSASWSCLACRGCGSAELLAAMAVSAWQGVMTSAAHGIKLIHSAVSSALAAFCLVLVNKYNGCGI